MGSKQRVKTGNKKQRPNVPPVLRSLQHLPCVQPCVDASLPLPAAVSLGLLLPGLVVQLFHRVPLADAFSPRSPVSPHAVHTHGAAQPAIPVV